MKILCWLGFHKWYWFYLDEGRNDSGMNQFCIHCSKERFKPDKLLKSK